MLVLNIAFSVSISSGFDELRHFIKQFFVVNCFFAKLSMMRQFFFINSLYALLEPEITLWVRIIFIKLSYEMK